MNTNSFFWQSVAPGLAQYPNTNMSVALKLASKSAVLLEGGGTYIIESRKLRVLYNYAGPVFGQISIYATFNLISGSTLKPAFTLEIDVYPTAMLYVKMVRLVCLK